MRTSWQSLAWKEWHEHKSVAFALLVLECGAFVLAHFEHGPFSAVFLVLMMVSAPAAVFVGMRTASSERPQQTMPFLSALPVSLPQTAIVKLLAGLLTCLIPLLLSLVAVWCWYFVRGRYVPGYEEAMRLSLRELHGFVNSDNWFFVAGLMLSSVTVSLYAWTIAFGVNRPDEISAGAWALAAMAIAWTIAGCAVWAENRLTDGALIKDFAWCVTAFTAALPCGFTSTHLQDYGSVVAGWFAGVFVASHAILGFSFVSRFGRSATSELWSPKQNVVSIDQHNDLAAPFRSQFTATIWKQFRESGPIALIGASAALAIALVFTAGIWVNENSVKVFEVFGAAWFALSLVLGGAATLVIGIGVFLRDLESGLNTFWRSRPILPDRWFWTRFASGLGTILLTLLLPCLTVAAVAAVARDINAEDFHDAASMFGTAVAIFIATYSVAVAATCLLRRAMFAGLVTLAATYFGAIAVVAIYVVWRCFTTHDWTPKHFEDVGTSVWVSGLVFDTLLGALMAWLAVRFDWGRKN